MNKGGTGRTKKVTSMRTCPSCHTQYTDDTLRFCLQDGTPLDTLPVTQQPTVSLAGQELETAARVNPPKDSEVTRWKQKSEVTHVSSLRPPASGSKAALVIAAVAAAMLLFFAAAGIGAWVYFKGRGGDIAKNVNNGPANQNSVPPSNINSNGRITPTPTSVPTPSATATAANNNSSPPIWILTPTPTPEIDKQRASREVSQQINSWKSLAESGDLNSYMRKYAGTVDYYRKRSASADFVRRDKQRAFNMFSSMSVTVSNLRVTVDDSGDAATAFFDKEWVFQGSHTSTGKVQQQMQFRKINGEWLITGERDVKVYYTN